MVIATHDVDFAYDWADRVLLLEQGSVAAEGTYQILTNQATTEMVGLPRPWVVELFEGRVASVDELPRGLPGAVGLLNKLLVETFEEEEETPGA